MSQASYRNQTGAFFILRHRRRRKIRFAIVIGFFATDAMLVLCDQYDADGRADEHSLGRPGEGTKANGRLADFVP